MTALNRRAFIASSALALPGTGAWAQSTRLRCFWWGNPDRDRRTRALLDAYSKGNNIQIAAESLGWGDYWTKLATQVAGGNPPDLIQMDYRYLFEYARRDTLLALDRLLPLPDFSANDRNGGKVDGKLYGVSLGSNSKAVVYDTDMLRKVGATLAADWTWEDFARIAAELSKLNPGKVWGASDNSRWEQGFEQWLNSRGKALYTPEGRVGFTVDDAASWFDHWDKLRKAGTVPPADVSASSNGKIEDFELTRGLAAMSFANSNQLVAFQNLNRSPLAIGTFPRHRGGTSGHYVKPAMMMSVSSRSRAPEEAAKLINHMVSDPEGVKILGIERGVPCSAAARAVLLPEADALGRRQIEYVALITRSAIPLPPPPPKGAGEIENLLRRVADSVAFGRASVRDGAAQFHNESVSILARG